MILHGGTMINTLLWRSFAGAVIHFGLLPLGASPDPGRKVCHEQDDREEAFDENIEDKEGDKEDKAECVYEEREAITLVICRASLCVSGPQAIGDQP